MDEFVKKDRKIIHVNIRFPAMEHFDYLNEKTKNENRLEVMHAALLQVAEYDAKLSKEVLNEIRQEILDNDFNFNFEYKKIYYKQGNSLCANILINPTMYYFEISIQIQMDEIEILKKAIFYGLKVDYYLNDLFSIGKWKNDNEFSITGKQKEVEIYLNLNECKVSYINLTQYPNPPFFQMMRAKISKEDKQNAYKDWIHSLPPHFAAMIENEENS